LKGQVREWKVPNYPTEAASQMWRHGRMGWERLIGSDKIRFDITKVPRPGYDDLIEEAIASWLDRPEAPVIVAQLHHKNGKKWLVNHFDVCGLLLRPGGELAEDALFAATKEQPAYMAKVLVDLLGDAFQDVSYDRIKVEIHTPSGALSSLRQAQKIDAQTITQSRPSSRRRL
jgi:hypothetical protein